MPGSKTARADRRNETDRARAARQRAGSRRATARCRPASAPPPQRERACLRSTTSEQTGCARRGKPSGALLDGFNCPDILELLHQLAKYAPANLEIGKLIERCTRGREQNDGLWNVCGSCVGGSERDRAVERARLLIGDAAVERRRELLGRLSDQVRLADAREIFRERADAARFGPAAGDPKNIREACERAGRRIGVGGLGIVDEEDRAAAADLLHSVREARKGSQRALDRVRRQSERQRRGGGAGGVLRIVDSAQRADAADANHIARPAAAPCFEYAIGFHIESVLDWALD